MPQYEPKTPSIPSTHYLNSHLFFLSMNQMLIICRVTAVLDPISADILNTWHLRFCCINHMHHNIIIIINYTHANASPNKGNWKKNDEMRTGRCLRCQYKAQKEVGLIQEAMMEKINIQDVVWESEIVRKECSSTELRSNNDILDLSNLVANNTLLNFNIIVLDRASHCLTFTNFQSQKVNTWLIPTLHIQCFLAYILCIRGQPTIL